jgi:autotransporter-associated beta strand protein
LTISSGAITGTTGLLTVANAIAVQSGSVSAILQGTAGMTKTGGGTVTLSAVNSYGGVTSLNGGTLALLGGGTLGSGNVDFNSGTLDISGKSGDYTLASTNGVTGTGTIITGTHTLNLTGVLSPGNGAAGTLNVNGNLNLGADSIFKIFGTLNFDQLIVIGTLTLNGNIDIVTDYAPVYGDQITIVQAGTLTGSANFTGTNFAPHTSWSVTQSGGDIILTAVPEPADWSLLAGAAALTLVRHRRRRI